MANSKTEKKSKGKPAEPAEPAEPAAGGDEDTAGELDNYNLEALEAELGAAAEPEIWDYVAGYERKALVEMGVQVASSRILTDCRRDYGRAASFLQRATPEQLHLLSEGITHLLRVGVSAARRCQSIERELTSGKAASAAKQLEARNAFKTLLERGRAERQLVRVRVRMVIAGDAVLLTALDEAHGTAATAGELALSLRNLVKLCRRLSRSKDPGVVNRLAGAGLTADRLAETEVMAAQVERAGAEAASVQTAPSVSQADLDLWDGINLVLYGLIKDFFEAARAIDPAIERLAPMALRGYFGRSRRRRKPDADAGASDSAGPE
jgi:hypothetical protein